MNSIYKKINTIMGTVPAIGKNGSIGSGTFSYQIRKADDVFNRVLPLLPTYGIVMAKEVLGYDQQIIEKTVKDQKKNYVLVNVTCKFTFFDAEDGSSVSTTSIGCGVDDLDKAYSKAQTVALRIALTEIFAIPFVESEWRKSDGDEPDAEQPIEQPIKPIKPITKPNDISVEFDAIKVTCRNMFSQLGGNRVNEIAIDCQDGKSPVNYDSWGLNTWQLFKDKLSSAIDISLINK
jgi:hypothetical protein